MARTTWVILLAAVVATGPACVDILGDYHVTTDAGEAGGAGSSATVSGGAGGMTTSSSSSSSSSTTTTGTMTGGGAGGMTTGSTTTTGTMTGGGAGGMTTGSTTTTSTMTGGGGTGGTTGSTVTSVCGDHQVEGDEECDDGNTTPCDGCSPTCKLDTSITYVAVVDPAKPILEDAYDGTQLSMTCVDVIVPSRGDGIVDYVCPTVAMQHLWIGAVVIKLVSPAGTAITLMNRPGTAEIDNGTSFDNGSGADLSPVSPVTWKDGAATSAENMGKGLGNGQVVCEDDQICVYDPNAGAATPGKLAKLIGEAGPGTWKLCVGDGLPGTTGGSIEQVRLVIGQ